MNGSCFAFLLCVLDIVKGLTSHPSHRLDNYIKKKMYLQKTKLSSRVNNFKYHGNFL